MAGRRDLSYELVLNAVAAVDELLARIDDPNAATDRLPREAVEVVRADLLARLAAAGS